MATTDRAQNWAQNLTYRAARRHRPILAGRQPAWPASRRYSLTARIFVSDGTSARRAAVVPVAGVRVAKSRGKPLARVGSGFAPV